MKALHKSLSLLLLLSLLLSLAACGSKVQEAPPTTSTTPTTTPTPPPPAASNLPDLSGQTAIVNTEGMTDLQKAIVVTAESFYMRGKYAQYDQYSMTSSNASEVDRRTYGIMAPEDYTAQFTSYTDCSSFVYDVYISALGMSISNTFPFTKTLCESSAYRVLREQPVKNKFAEMTAEQLAAKEKEFRETLQPGDIIVHRNAKNTSGHAILYVGHGMRIHSTGTSYDYTTATDKGRETGTYRYESIDNLFNPNSGEYLFGKSVYVILRPLSKFTREIPENTQQRMGLMRGIKAEKLCSHTYGQTVNPGDTLTFTFRLQNNSNITKPLTITDTVPDGATYVSGAQTVNGKALSWTVTVPTGETVDVSYSVKVDSTTVTGTYIQSNSTVSGIAVNCPRVMVAKTLTDAQQQAVTAALADLKDSAKGIALVNAIYEKACGKSVFTQQDTAALWNDLVDTYSGMGSFFTGKKPLAPMVAPCLYGGRTMSEQHNIPALTRYRTRLVTNSVLVIGDIVLADSDLYLFTGEGLYNLTKPETTTLKNPKSLLSANKFVVLRPSMAF